MAKSPFFLQISDSGSEPEWRAFYFCEKLTAKESKFLLEMLRTAQPFSAEELIRIHRPRSRFTDFRLRHAVSKVCDDFVETAKSDGMPEGPATVKRMFQLNLISQVYEQQIRRWRRAKSKFAHPEKQKSRLPAKDKWKLYPIADVAKRLCRDPKTIKAWIKKGILPGRIERRGWAKLDSDRVGQLEKSDREIKGIFGD